MLAELSKTVPTHINPVAYKFRIPELAEWFESYNAEQTHIVLEGALNIIFGQPTSDAAGLVGEGEELQSEDQDKLDHEQRIVDEVTFALVAHEQGKLATDDVLAVVDDAANDDTSSSPLYQEMENHFRNIVAFISATLDADKFNQDIVTLHGEMQFYPRIELYTYNYDTKSEILLVSVTSVI